MICVLTTAKIIVDRGTQYKIKRHYCTPYRRSMTQYFFEKFFHISRVNCIQILKFSLLKGPFFLPDIICIVCAQLISIHRMPRSLRFKLTNPVVSFCSARVSAHILRTIAAALRAFNYLRYFAFECYRSRRNQYDKLHHR